MGWQSAIPSPQAQSKAFCKSTCDTPGRATHQLVPSRNVVLPSGGDNVFTGIAASAFSSPTPTPTPSLLALVVVVDTKNKFK